MKGLDAVRVANGSFGEMWIDGQWWDHINSLNAVANLQKSALSLSGTRWQRNKYISVNGTGTASGFKADSRIIQMHAWVMDDGAPTGSTEIITALKDPEMFGHERIRLIGVKFDSFLLANWTAGAEVTEEMPFTFEGFYLMDAIVRP